MIAVEVDGVLGDTRPLWHAWLEDLARRSRVDISGLPENRRAAAGELDERIGNWRALLERFAEDHAPVYLRANAEVSTALRHLQASGARLVALTDAPVELARVALAHLGATRRVESVVSDPPPGALVVRSREELLLQSKRWSERG